MKPPPPNIRHPSTRNLALVFDLFSTFGVKWIYICGIGLQRIWLTNRSSLTWTELPQSNFHHSGDFARWGMFTLYPLISIDIPMERSHVMVHIDDIWMHMAHPLLSPWKIQLELLSPWNIRIIVIIPYRFIVPKKILRKLLGSKGIHTIDGEAPLMLGATDGYAYATDGHDGSGLAHPHYRARPRPESASSRLPSQSWENSPDLPS